MKIGDKVNVIDVSYSFGICDGKYFKYGLPFGHRSNLTIIETGLFIMETAGGETTGKFRQQNDLLVTDEKGNFWFTQSRFCKLVNKEIEIRYFCDGEDVTDSISDETKRNLKD